MTLLILIICLASNEWQNSVQHKFTLPNQQEKGFEISSNGNNPIEPLTRTDLRLESTNKNGVDQITTRYTFDWAFSSNQSTGIEIPYVFSELDSEDTRGEGDIILKHLFVPYGNFKMSGKPRNFPCLTGIGLLQGILLPTGDIDDATGSGQLLAKSSLTAGFNPFRDIEIYPTTTYYHSFIHKDDANMTREFEFNLRAIYNFTSFSWIIYAPEIFEDLTDHKSTFINRFILGTMLNKSTALTIGYAAHTSGKERFDNQIVLAFRYLF
ncbi:MAG: hypothetical protein HY606_09535 [Planctomycetes bacterium]|nr:hypothetical protein [Planctomycetota bacterium]